MAAALKIILYTTDKMHGCVGDMHTATFDIDIGLRMRDFTFQAQ
jgi:hypothetical protein